MAGSVESSDGTMVGFMRYGEGPPMVMVHGAAMDRRSWGRVMPRLAEHFTVHLVDRRGRGLSTAQANSYGIEREGEDIAAVVEAAGREVFLVGHSYGALCSLEAALITDAIGRMLLFEPPGSTPGHQVSTPEDREQLRIAAAAGDLDGVLETFLRGPIRMSTEDIGAMRATPVWTASLGAAPNLVREVDCVEAFDTSDRLSRIGVPVRMLLGTESQDYLPAMTAAIAARLPRVEIVHLSGQGHMAMDNDPNAFAAAVLDFVP